MTSPANTQNIPAPNSTAPSATASYASAVSASGKVFATPVIATGSALPAVVHSSSASHNLGSGNARSASASPLNSSAGSSKPNNTTNMAGASPAASNGSGSAKPAISPAVPAVLNGSSADHARKSSVTISAAGPSSYVGNGGPAGTGPKANMPQFGYESPSITHSTPSQPMAGNQPIPSPKASPSPIPIPQNSASGGRPPSIPQEGAGAGMKFGSFGGDGDRHLKNNFSHAPGNLPVNSPHYRRSSTHSVHSDIGNPAGNHTGPHGNGSHGQGNHGHHGGPGPGRGGFTPGRGRGGYTHYNNQAMSFQPQGGPYPRGPSGQGRGNMAPQFQPRGVMQPNFGPNSPQAAAARVSPAIPPVMPQSNTPQMPTAIPANTPAGPPFVPMQYQAAPAGFPPMPPNNYHPYPGQYNAPMMGFPAYGQMGPYTPQMPGPMYGHPYSQFVPPTGAQPMSRTSSQAASERPGSGQGHTPTTTQATLHAPATPGSGVPKSGTPATSAFGKPKTTAVTIKTPSGQTINFNSMKPPASPAPSTPVTSRTPPVVVSSTPPPAPKPTPPIQGKTDSTTAEKTRNDFREQVKMRAEAEAGNKTKEEGKDDANESKDVAKTESKVEVSKEETTDQKKSEPVIVSSSPAPAAEVKPKSEVMEDVKPTAETASGSTTETTQDEKSIAARESDAAKTEPPVPDDDDMERIIREMEEEDARREAEQAAITAAKKAQQEEKKMKAAADDAKNSAENDRKLREQEREMERLEEERERRRKANEVTGTKSVSELLAEGKPGAASSDSKDTSTTDDALASKFGDLKLGDRAKPSLSPASETATKQQRAKPSALNLAPLNTKPVEPPQPSAALQSLKTARFLRDPTSIAYPKGIQSPNPALNPAVNKKGNFKYDMGFLLQFKDVFVEKPSLDFDQQVKQLIGDGESAPRSGARTPAGGNSARQNSRNAGSSFTPGGMGGMGSFNTKPMTSEDRSGGTASRPPMGSMQFGRPGGFPGSTQMTRQPSGFGGMPNSPRQGSRSARGGGSRQTTQNAKAEAAAAKTMPLTQGKVVKPITVSATGWKPRTIGSRGAGDPAAPGTMDPEMVQRKVKAALNKMTPEKFEKISDQILAIALQSKDEEDGRTLRQVIQLTFEKATDEAHWAPMYARFCKRMLDTMSPDIRDVTLKDRKGEVISGGTLFRKYLLNRCQEEFERGWKVDIPQPKEGETAEMAMLSDEYYEAVAAKRRGLGLVQFIGELYKLGMLTERIMHECVRKLVDYETTPDEAEIESLSKLLRTVGANLDDTEKGRPMMDAYFVRIKNIIDIPDLPSRLKFMLMDIIDLRDRHWVSNEANKGPKTLEEVRQDAEAQAAQKAMEAARTSSQRGGGGRPGLGRGDARQFSYNQPVNNQVGMDDLRRLKSSTSRIASSSMTTLGPTSMFASRSNSGRRNGPGGSFGRPGDDSGPASRTGTPPTRTDSNSVSHTNAFEALANVDTDTPTSPPSTAVSPALSKSNLDKGSSK